MSYEICIKDINTEEKLEIKNNLMLTFKDKIYKTLKILTCYKIIEKDNIKFLILPFFYKTLLSKTFPNYDKKAIKKDIKFLGELRQEQKDIVKESISYLNKYRTLSLFLGCGFGKTIYSIYLCSLIGLTKICIVVFNIVLYDKWKIEIENNTKSRYQIISKSNMDLDKEADFIIISNKIASKKDIKFFKDVNVLIVDETHQSFTPEYIKFFFLFRPKFMLCLTATPNRTDNMSDALKFFYGEHYIKRDVKKSYKIYKVNTKIKPNYDLNAKGRPDWTSLLKSLCYNEKRNIMIVKIIKKFINDNKNIILFSKRKDHCKILKELLLKDDIKCDIITGDEQIIEGNKILMGTYKKLGIGFDSDIIKLKIGKSIEYNVVIFGIDVIEIEQFIGRARTKNVTIIDIIDEFSSLKNHWRLRRKWFEGKDHKIEKLKI